jgi:PAS domain S-box-containing protein
MAMTRLKTKTGSGTSGKLMPDLKADKLAPLPSPIPPDELANLLLQSTAEGVYGIDLNGNAIFVNPACVRILGFSSDEELMGQHMHNLVHHTRPNGSYYPAEECQIYQALRDQKGINVDSEVMFRADGSSFPVEYWSYPMIKDGELVGAVVAFVDITERLQLQNDIVAAQALAEKANQAKSAFLANMSHELRTPMNAIIGYSEMLAEDAKDDGLDDMLVDLGKITAAGKHLLSLINDILDLSKIEAGKMDLFLETFPVAEMMNDVANTAVSLIEKNNNTSELVIAEDVGDLHADMTKIRQVLFNLISNAAKFTKEGTITLRASREMHDELPWIRFAVSDTGIGIPEDKIDQIFEEFSQADESTTKDYGGTGLGLTLTKRFCEMMGGSIKVESVTGSGSTFIFSIPAIVEKKLENLEQEAILKEDATSKTHHLGFDGDDTTAEGMDAISAEVAGKPIVLVIDDEADARELLRRHLESEGCKVVIAQNGIEGLTIAASLRPNLITLDVMMPEMDGWAVLKTLKADPDLKDIPVIMISIVGDKAMSYALGAVEALQKPIDRKYLQALVARYAQSFGKSALIVEDDPPSRSIIKKFLESENWRVEEAENGAEGLDKTSNAHFDLILLDLMMPVMDGFEFLQRLRRSDSSSAKSPVVVITAKDLTADDRDRLLENVEEVILKTGSDIGKVMDDVRRSLVAAGYKGRDGRGGGLS